MKHLLALELSPFDSNMNDKTISISVVGCWIIKKFSRGKSVETVKIWDNPRIQIGNNNSRIIDASDPQKIRTSTKLLPSSKVQVAWFYYLRPT